MATRRTPSRLDKRREVEAVEAAAASPAAAKGKKVAAAKKKPVRRKAKVTERKRLVWGVFTGALKEEARFPFDQKAAAEERLELLRSKGKKLYFLQAIKESITDGAHPGRSVFVDDEDENTSKARRAKRQREKEEAEEEVEEVEVEAEADDDDE